MVINEDKSYFGVTEVDFVGNRVSTQGVAPLNLHIDAIIRLEASSSLKGVRAVLGAAGYCRKFVPRYADIIEPLNALLRSDTSFIWSKECQHAFEELKNELVSAKVVAHFDQSLDTVVTTDASAVAIGAVLSQL